MTTRYVPWEVYKNLKMFLEHRKVTSVTSADIAEGEFSNIFNHYGYTKITGRRNDKHGDRSFHILLIAPNSHYASKLPSFKKLLNMVPSEDFTKNTEIVIISETELTNFIKAHILERRTENPQLYIEHYTYSYFSTVIPRQTLVPKHEIPPSDEVREFCETHRTKKEKLPKIYVSDAPVVWLGVRAGDVVKVERRSYAVGTFPIYKYVIKGTF